MPKASDLKRGMVVDIADDPHLVKSIDVKSPSSRGAATLYKIRFNNLKTGQKRDESFKGDDFIKDANCLRTQVQYSYFDGEAYTFMNLDDYSQYGLNADELEGQIEYLVEGQEGITALLVDDVLVAIELPMSVVLNVTETAPGIKGSGATARTKPATLQTGLEIQVPEYLETGENVKVNTQTGKFISRA